MEMKSFIVHNNFRAGRADYPGLKVIYAKEAGNHSIDGEIFVLAPQTYEIHASIPESALIRCEGVTHFGGRPLYMMNQDFEI